jgi:cytochrome c biogenesis protein CcmG/thiol:disulfide interchange protein DsbE
MSKSRFGNLITIFSIAIILIASAFSIACNMADPPRPVEGAATVSSSARAPRPIPTRDPAAIESASAVEITKLDGGGFKLADFRGKVLVVDFWATYCPPCVKQVPQLAELSRKYRDQGVAVVGLTSDDRADQQQVVEFLKKANADYTVGYDNQWVSSAFLKGTENADGTTPIPQLFVLSRDGRVIEHLVGDDPQRGVEYLERVVNQQLALK